MDFYNINNRVINIYTENTDTKCICIDIVIIKDKMYKIHNCKMLIYNITDLAKYIMNITVVEDFILDNIIDNIHQYTKLGTSDYIIIEKKITNKMVYYEIDVIQRSTNFNNIKLL